MAQYLTLDLDPVPVRLAALGGDDSNAVFLIPPVSEADLDDLGMELFRHNIAPTTQETFRAKFFDEIYEIYEEGEADELANMLDAHWQAEDQHKEAMDDWQLEEDQRLIDIEMGAEHRDPKPLPKRLTSPRERARAVSFAEDLKQKSRVLRDFVVEMQTYSKRASSGLARIILSGWEGLETPFVKEHGIVPEETYRALRNEIGRAAIAQLELAVVSSKVLERTEVGNFVWPPESKPVENGSAEQNSDQEPNDGNSTGSPTGQTPAEESAKTTAESFGSTGSFDGDPSNNVSIPAETLSAAQR